MYLDFFTSRRPYITRVARSRGRTTKPHSDVLELEIGWAALFRFTVAWSVLDESQSATSHFQYLAHVTTVIITVSI